MQEGLAIKVISLCLSLYSMGVSQLTATQEGPEAGSIRSEKGQCQGLLSGVQADC